MVTAQFPQRTDEVMQGEECTVRAEKGFTCGLYTTVFMIQRCPTCCTIFITGTCYERNRAKVRAIEGAGISWARLRVARTTYVYTSALDYDAAQVTTAVP